MPISCYFRDCKALLVTSLTDVNGAIASVKTFTLYEIGHFTACCIRPSIVNYFSRLRRAGLCSHLGNSLIRHLISVIFLHMSYAKANVKVCCK